MNTEQNDGQALSDLEAIRLLRARYTRAIDTKDWDLFGACLTDDAQLHTDGGTQAGRDAIVAGTSAALTGAVTVHHIHQPEIEFTGADTATGLWAMNDVVDFKRDGVSVFGVRGYGHYKDEYRRTDDGWKVSSSTLTRLRVDTEGEYPGAG
jgi:uncharacterized protein (TIGR02246 family)